MLSDEKTYSERLFIYKEVGSLSYEQSEKAITEPVKKLRVTYTRAAVDKIISITKGYLFFIQQFCKLVYQDTEGRVFGQ